MVIRFLCFFLPVRVLFAVNGRVLISDIKHVFQYFSKKKKKAFTTDITNHQRIIDLTNARPYRGL